MLVSRVARVVWTPGTVRMSRCCLADTDEGVIVLINVLFPLLFLLAVICLARGVLLLLLIQ